MEHAIYSNVYFKRKTLRTVTKSRSSTLNIFALFKKNILKKKIKCFEGCSQDDIHWPCIDQLLRDRNYHITSAALSWKFILELQSHVTAADNIHLITLSMLVRDSNHEICTRDNAIIGAIRTICLPPFPPCEGHKHRQPPPPPLPQ